MVVDGAVARTVGPARCWPIPVTVPSDAAGSGRVGRRLRFRIGSRSRPTERRDEEPRRGGKEFAQRAFSGSSPDRARTTGKNSCEVHYHAVASNLRKEVPRRQGVYHARVRCRYKRRLGATPAGVAVACTYRRGHDDLLLAPREAGVWSGFLSCRALHVPLKAPRPPRSSSRELAPGARPRARSRAGPRRSPLAAFMGADTARRRL